MLTKEYTTTPSNFTCLSTKKNKKTHDCQDEKLELSYILQKLKEKTLEILQTYIDLKQVGSVWQGLCPFHSETNPSFTVYPENGHIFCFGCGWSGDIIKFVQEKEKMNFIQAVQYLAEKYLSLSFTFNRKAAPVPLSWNGKKLAKIYTYTHPLSGKKIGYVARYENKEGKEVVPFFIFMPGNNGTRFELGLPGAYKRCRPWYFRGNIQATTVLVVEGEKCVDALSNFLSLSEENIVVATWQGGCKAAQFADLSFFDKLPDCEAVFFIPDFDEQGIGAMRILYHRLKQAKPYLHFYVVYPRLFLFEILSFKKGFDIADFLSSEVAPDRKFKKFCDFVYENVYLNVHRLSLHYDFFKELCLLYEVTTLCVDFKKAAREEKDILKRQIIMRTRILLQFRFAFLQRHEKYLINKENTEINSLNILKAYLEEDLCLPFEIRIKDFTKSLKTYRNITVSRSIQDPASFNAFAGFAIDPVQCSCENFLNFLYEIICAGDKAKYEWLLDWLAFLFQFPEKKSEQTVAIVLQGDSRTGKTFFAEHILSLLAGNKIKIEDKEMLFSRFNSFLADKILVFIEEAIKFENKRELSLLKDFITGTTRTYDVKFKQPLTVQNFMRFLIITNEEHIANIALSEQRFTIFNVSARKQNDTLYFTQLHEAWERGEKAGFLHFLLNRKISHNLRYALQTQELQAQKVLSLSWEERWLVDFVLNADVENWDEQPVFVSTRDLYESYLAFLKKFRRESQAVSPKMISIVIRKYLSPDRTRDAHTRYYVFPPRNIAIKALAERGLIDPEDSDDDDNCPF